MTDLETCYNAIGSCDTSDESIEACLATLRPILEPYFPEDEFDARFAALIPAQVKVNNKIGLQKAVEGLLQGPTYAEQVKIADAARKEQEVAMLAKMVEQEKTFISTLLTKIGFRKGDQIPVRYANDDGSPGGTRLIPLDQWNLPELETPDDSKAPENDASE